MHSAYNTKFTIFWKKDFQNIADTDHLLKLAFLCDIFDKLNSMNLSLQGNNTHILKLIETITTFRRKLQIWIRKNKGDGGQDCFLELHKLFYLLMSSLSLSRLAVTFPSFKGLQYTSRKKMSRNFHGWKMFFMFSLHQDSIRRKSH